MVAIMVNRKNGDFQVNFPGWVLRQPRYNFQAVKIELSYVLAVSSTTRKEIECKPLIFG